VSVIKIGCDPEGFLVDGSGEFVPAISYVPGSKEEPFKLDGGAVQVDGLAIEFNIDAAETEEQFTGNIRKVLIQIDDIIRSVDKDVRIRWTPVATFRQTVWNMTPEQCKILGCDPDFNVKGDINENPTLRLENNPVRTAAGHIHIGWLDELLDNPMDGDHFGTCLDIAQGFFHGHLSTFIPNTPEEEERMKYYGHSGSFRPKRYGIELRAPSNLWVRTEETQKLVFNQTRKRFHELTGL
jgi:hypothetical protein